MDNLFDIPEKKSGEKITSADLLKMLAVKYPSPEYGLFSQCRNATGYAACRSADAVVMSLWPSRGFQLIGFEIKVSRSDWLSELKKPQKAEPIFQYCDKWYLVTSEENIVQGDELPLTWGHIYCTGKKLKYKKNAPDLKPVPIDRDFLAALFRNVAEKMIAKDLITDKIQAAREDGMRLGESGLHRAQEQTELLKNHIAAFEEKSGLNINTYNAGKIGETVKMVLDGKHERIERKLSDMREGAKRIIKLLDDEIQGFQL